MDDIIYYESFDHFCCITEYVPVFNFFQFLENNDNFLSAKDLGIHFMLPPLNQYPILVSLEEEEQKEIEQQLATISTQYRIEIEEFFSIFDFTLTEEVTGFDICDEDFWDSVPLAIKYFSREETQPILSKLLFIVVSLNTLLLNYCSPLNTFLTSLFEACCANYSSFMSQIGKYNNFPLFAPDDAKQMKNSFLKLPLNNQIYISSLFELVEPLYRSLKDDHSQQSKFFEEYLNIPFLLPFLYHLFDLGSNKIVSFILQPPFFG